MHIRRLYSSRGMQLLLVFTACFLVGLTLVLLLREPISYFGKIGNDLYPRWVGARAFWHGQSPYDEAVRTQTQAIFNSGPMGKAFAFYYPAYLAIIIAPLLLLPVEWAGIVWSALTWAALATVIFYWLWRTSPRPGPLLWGALVFGLFLFRPAIPAFIGGQYGILVLAALVLADWLLSDGQDFLAGIVLVLPTIKPSLALFAVLVILIWSVRARRFKLLFGFTAAALVLGGITLYQIGWWVPDFVSQMLGYEGDTRTLGMAWSSSDILTPLGLFWLAGSLALLVLGVKDFKSNAFPWLAVFASLFLNLLVSPHVLEYDLVILLLPLLWLLGQWREQRLMLALWFFLLWFPWLFWLVAAFILGNFDPGEMWRTYPLLLMVVLLVARARTPASIEAAAQ